MTRFGEEVTFSPEYSTKFHDLPVCSAKNNFLVNTARNSISSIEAHSQKIVQSWTLTHPYSFTSPASYCSSDDTISCIIDENILMIWPRSSDDLDSGTKIKLKKPAFSTISTENFSTFVVFRDGTILSIENVASEKDGNCNIEDSEELFWANIVQRQNTSDEAIVALLTRNKNVKHYMLRSFSMSNNASRTLLVQQPIVHGDESLKSWCLLDSMHFPCLLTLWSDQKVVSFCLKQGTSRILFSLCDVGNLPAVIDVVGKSHLVVARVSSKKDAVLELWDLKYAVKKCSKLLKQPLPKNMQIKGIGCSVFLSLNDGIMKVPLSLESSSLASVIGKVASVDTNKGQPKFFSWPEETFMCDDEDHDEAMDISTSTSLRLDSEKLKEMMSSDLDDAQLQYFSNVHKLQDIPEKELVKMLQVALQFDIEEDNSKNTILNSIFRIPFTDIFLRQHLKNLNFKEALTTLGYLVQLFNSEFFCRGDREKPSDLQIVCWMQLLIQSHFDEIVLATDDEVVDLVMKMRQTLLEKMQVYSDVSEIKYLMKLIKKKMKILPQKHTRTKYSIEVLHL